MIAIRHLNSDPEIAVLPNIHPQHHTHPTSGSHITHTLPTVNLVECTSHITSRLQHRCLTSWGKLPQYETFPLASMLHTNPSQSLVLSLGLSHTNTHRQRDQNHTPPTPTFSTATTRWCALKPWVDRKQWYTLGAPMQHHETTQRVTSLASLCCTEHWSLSKTGFTWPVLFSSLMGT